MNSRLAGPIRVVYSEPKYHFAAKPIASRFVQMDIVSAGLGEGAGRLIGVAGFFF